MLRMLFVLILIAVGVRFSLRGSFYSLLFYLWIAYFRPESWVWSDFIQSLDLSFIVGTLVIVSMLFSPSKFRLNFRLGLLLLIIGQSLLSTLVSPHYAFAWGYFVDFAKTALVAYLIGILAIDVARFRTTLLVIALSLGFEATKQGWVTLVLHPGAVNINEHPMLGDNNGVAVGMIMLAALLIALASTATGKWERRGFQFAIIGVIYRGLSTYSRGGLLGFAAAALWYICRSRQKFVALSSLVLACAIVLPVLPNEFWDRMSTINAANEGVDHANELAGGRIHFWQVGLAMANDRPFTGVGLNAFTQAYDRYDFEQGKFGAGRSVHSAWFGTLAELGYPGLLIFVLLIAASYAACFRARAAVARGAPAALESYALAIEVALTGFSVGGAFVPFQYTEFLWHIFGLSAALAVMAKQYAKQPEKAVNAVSLEMTMAQVAS